MKTLIQGYLDAVTVYHCRHGHVDRAVQVCQLARTPDTRPAVGVEIGTAITAAGSRIGHVNGDSFRWTLDAELFEIPENVRAGIAAARHVHLRVDSPGGDALTALELLTALAGKTVRVDVRRAASAAAVLAICALGKRTITPDGSIVLHPPAVAAIGTSTHLRERADRLDEVNDQLIDVLAARTRQPRAVVSGWLSGDDVEFSPEQALAAGLVDTILVA